MKYATLFLGLVPLLTFANSNLLSVNIKGLDDGIKTTVQQDYKEAVLFAKREAIERAGGKIQSMTTAEDFIVRSDVIESHAEAVLEPGYDILDIGYQQDGSYLIVLTGTIRLINDSATPPDSTPASPLHAGLTALAAAPEDYGFHIENVGTYAIEKAYFANPQQFVIHYGFKNGMITLNNVDKGIALLSGTYQTDTDQGNVKLDFETDGSANGRWIFGFFSGGIAIRQHAELQRTEP